MRTNARIFYGVTAFFLVSSIVYWFTSKDPTGTTALAFAVGLGFLIAYYLQFTARRLPDQLEDLPNADVEEGAGEIGFFSPHSQWPFFMGLGAAVMMLGFPFGWWLLVIGAGILGGATLGLVFEYYVSAASETSTREDFSS